jgi:hypothetical protein
MRTGAAWEEFLAAAKETSVDLIAMGHPWAPRLAARVAWKCCGEGRSNGDRPGAHGGRDTWDFMDEHGNLVKRQLTGGGR